MNNHIINTTRRQLLMGIFIWIAYALQAYFLNESSIVNSIFLGLVYSIVFNLTFHLLGLDSALLYCKPEYENDIIEKIESLGYKFNKNKKGKQIYIKDHWLKNKSIQLQKTPFNIQISVPTWENPSFSSFTQSRMATS